MIGIPCDSFGRFDSVCVAADPGMRRPPPCYALVCRLN